MFADWYKTVYTLNVVTSVCGLCNFVRCFIDEGMPRVDRQDPGPARALCLTFPIYGTVLFMRKLLHYAGED